MNIKRFGWLMLAVLFLSPVADGGAETCFTSLYYSAMFKPVALKAETGGNANLMAESDVLTATGKDPHDKGKGCMCGVNNGRFDLLLRNAEAVGSDQPPVSFRLQAIRITFRDRKGTLSDRTVRIEDARIDGCFDTPMPLKAYRSFDDARGRAKTPRILEPGEGIMGCVCISARDRARTGEARIEVAYEPVVPAHDDTEASGAESSFIAAGPPAVRVFRAHTLSIGGGGKASLFSSAEMYPCCSDSR